MLVFPHWRTELPNEACRALRWAPPERFAPYIARPMVYHPSPLQVEDDTSSGGSSPERDAGAGGGEAAVCGWRGCGAIFPGVARLSAHVARVHAQPHRDGLFYCAWGDCARAHRGFNARYKMLVHVRTHTNERPHTCIQCNKSFSRAENLKIHLRSHSGEKPYVCPYEGCGKAYSNSSDRFKHTRTHTVDKPYCCKVAGCNKRYTDPSSLRKHVKTYKHYTPKEIIRQESSDDMHSQYSLQDNASYPEMESTSHSYHSPPRAAVSPVFSSISPVPGPIIRYAPPVEQLTYLRPSPPLHPLRVPTYEMSYLEYTQMYEHAYRSYYSANMDYTLRATVCEKTLSYEDVTMSERRQGSPEITRYEDEEMPLNLISSKRLDCKPIEELVRRTDLPLDLSVRLN